MKHQRAIVLGAGAAIATGIVFARRFTPSGRLNRLLNGNLHLFTNRSDRQALQTLASSGNKSYLLRGWPRPGVNDAAKRQLVVKAAASTENQDQIESTRLEILQAPLCETRPHTLETHGDARIDDFYWLRDDDRKNKDVIAHLNAENTYTKNVMADTEILQETLYKEMRGRIQEADQSAPQRFHGYWYYTRTEEGAQYAVHCRRALPASLLSSVPLETDSMDAASAPEEIILDENEEAKGHDFYMVGGFEVSPDHKLVAYGVDLKGNESYELRVKDLTTGKQLLSTPIPDTAGNFAWAADNKTLFYVTKDKLDRPFKVWRHVLGENNSGGGEDALVYHEKDDAFYIGISDSRSEKMLYIHSGSAVTSDVRMLAADNPTGEWQIVLPRKENVEYSVDDRGDQLFITIRDTERPNSEVLVAPISDPSAATVVLPHRPDVKLGHIEVANEFLVAFERENGLQQAVVYTLPMKNDGKDPAPVEIQAGNSVEGSSMSSPLGEGKPITFEEPTYELSGGSQGDFNSPLLRFHYTSLTTPDTVYDYNMKTGQRAIKKVQPVLGGFDRTKYKTERLWATAPDGVQVPISIVYRTDLVKLDGTDPMLLDAYGSYEISNDADFRSSRLSLIDRGFVFGIAHVRGGGEMGRTWYEDGKYLKKKNTFTDFISCAELLIAKKFTSKERLAISGRSAGGLTMGAVINMRPDLFNAAILGVPFVDVLTTMLDHSIPLTTIEVEEWGDPQEKEYYDYMKSYSPIDNIKAGEEYPNMLVTGGLHDPRVGYWEPAKLVAKLRKEAKNASGKMLLLKLEMGAGHFSQSGRFDKLKEVAQEHAFLLKCQGMLETPLKPSGSSS
jgi:oligopeptidase B